VRLVIAVVQDYDANPFLRALAEAGYRATLLRTTGGFLRQGNTTVLVAVEDLDVAAVSRLCRDTCARRLAVAVRPDAATVDADPAEVVDVRIGGGVLFVVRLAALRQFDPSGRERVSAGSGGSG